MEREGNLSLNTRGIIIRYSQGLENILGYTARDVIGRPLAELAPSESRPTLATLLDVVKTSNYVIDYQTTILHKDGSHLDIFISVYPLRDMRGRLYSYLVNMSTQKTSTPPAILSEEFQMMFRFSNDAVVITDRNGDIIDVNQMFLKMYGYEKEEVIGRNPRFLRSRHSTKELYKKMWSDLLNPEKGFWKGEIINKRKDGTEIPVFLSINAIADREGRIKNFLGIAFDMSRQKELDRIRRLYVDYFIHDLKGPITAIINNAELLKINLADRLSEKDAKRLRTIITCSERINLLTEDVLEYMRVQEGSPILRKERVSLASIINDIILLFEMYRKTLFINDSDYAEWIDKNDIELYVDPEKFRRILYNLLSNAYKNAASEIRLSVKTEEDGYRFRIWNDGIGISHKEAEKVFDAFYQTKEGVRTGGAGLGLSIVKSFISLHNGKVWVEPGRERGIAFCFFIPSK